MIDFGYFHCLPYGEHIILQRFSYFHYIQILFVNVCKKFRYQYTAKIMEQGQIEKSMVDGSSMKLADYYWGVVYLYSLKRLFTTEYEMISVEDLERTIVKG